MSKEINIQYDPSSNEYDVPVHQGRVKKLAKHALTGIGLAVGGAVLAGGGHQVVDAMNGPEFSGNKTVTIEPGDRLDNIINEEVDGGASHTGDVRAEVKSDPDNQDVFENGLLDPGEELEIPEKVTN